MCIRDSITTVIGCTGGNNGAIDLSVTGGSPAYGYAWSTGATTQDISGLAAGTYTVTVTDSHGCTKVQAFVVGQFGDLMLDIDSTNPICAGTNSGTIDLTITGGLAPYLIDWSNTVSYTHLDVYKRQVTKRPIVPMC